MILQAVADIPIYYRQIIRVLESMLFADLSCDDHLQLLIDSATRAKNYTDRPNFHDVPILTDTDAVHKALVRNIGFCGIHAHHPTCRKGDKGQLLCRVCKKNHLKSKTGCVQLGNMNIRYNNTQ